jgi:hypothetical protein
MHALVIIGTVGAPGNTAALIVAILFVLGLAYWRRNRRLKGELEGRRSYGLVNSFASGVAAAGEFIAVLLAWLVITHASTPLVGLGLSVLLVTFISASVFSARSHRVSGVFKSLWNGILYHSNSRNAAIAVVVGFAFGYYYGSYGGGVLLAGVLVGWETGRLARRSDDQARAQREAIAGSVAAALGISVPALEGLSWFETSNGSIIIERPAAAILNADRLHERVATLLPHLEVSEVSPARISLSPLSEGGADSRAHTQLSGGLVTGSADAARPNATQKAPSVGVQHVINLDDLQ